MPEPLDDATMATALLARAGIEPTTEWDRQALVAGYAVMRASAELLHGVAEARYEVPAVGFDVTAQTAKR